MPKKSDRFGWLKIFNRLKEDESLPWWVRVYRSSYYRALGDAFKIVTGPLNFEAHYEAYNDDGTLYNPGGVFDYLTGFIFYAFLRGYQRSSDAVEKTQNSWWYVPATLNFFVAGAGWLGRVALGIACLPMLAILIVPFRSYFYKKSQPLRESINQLEGNDVSTGNYRPANSSRKVALGDFLGYHLELDNLQASYTTKKVRYTVHMENKQEITAVNEPSMLGRATHAVYNYAASFMSNPKPKSSSATTQPRTIEREVIDTITLSYTPPDPSSSSWSCTPGWGFMSWFGVCCPTLAWGYTLSTLPQQGLNYVRQGAELVRGVVDPDAIKFTIKVDDKIDSPQRKQLESLFKMNVGFLFTQTKQKGLVKEDSITHQLRFR